MKVNVGLVVFLFGVCSLLLATDFAPSFLQPGRHYIGNIVYQDSEFLVLEIGDQGWIKVDSDGKVLWINTSLMEYISEISPEDEKTYLNRKNQKRTLSDMRAIGTACEAYAVDSNQYPYSFSTKVSDLISSLEPIYIKTLPVKDGWGQELIYYTDPTFQIYWIISTGADGKREVGIYDSYGTPLPGGAGVTNDMDADIIFSQGSFFRFPEGIAQ
jgi:Type II secretion system (T2SS), protein G